MYIQARLKRGYVGLASAVFHCEHRLMLLNEPTGVRALSFVSVHADACNWARDRIVYDLGGASQWGVIGSDELVSLQTMTHSDAPQQQRMHAKSVMLKPNMSHYNIPLFGQRSSPLHNAPTRVHCTPCTHVIHHTALNPSQLHSHRCCIPCDCSHSTPRYPNHPIQLVVQPLQQLCLPYVPLNQPSPPSSRYPHPRLSVSEPHWVLGTHTPAPADALQATAQSA